LAKEKSLKLFIQSMKDTGEDSSAEEILDVHSLTMPSEFSYIMPDSTKMDEVRPEIVQSIEKWFRTYTDTEGKMRVEFQVMLLCSLEGFTEAVQDTFKIAIAAAASAGCECKIAKTEVDITHTTEKAALAGTRRRLHAASITVVVSILVPDAKTGSLLVQSDALSREAMNNELVKRGLEPITQVTSSPGLKSQDRDREIFIKQKAALAKGCKISESLAANLFAQRLEHWRREEREVVVTLRVVDEVTKGFTTKTVSCKIKNLSRLSSRKVQARLLDELGGYTWKQSSRTYEVDEDEQTGQHDNGPELMVPLVSITVQGGLGSGKNPQKTSIGHFNRVFLTCLSCD
jgi:hypothetical protein